jgi:hypothetical protein
MIDLYTERKMITKYNCEAFIGYTVYMEEQVREQIKKLKDTYENMFIQGKLRECMKTIGRDEFMERIDEVFAICTGDEK